MKATFRLFLCTLCAAVALFTAPALAQGFPSRPVTLVVPFGAGGATDAVARLVAERLSAKLGQNVVVENRTGAGGIPGAVAVKNADPTGYTLLVSTSGSQAAAPLFAPTMPYDPVADFTPVAMLGTTPFMFIVHPSVPANTIAEMTKVLKEKPGALNVASAGNGTLGHLSAELYQSMAGVKMQHVPYRGTGPAYPDLLSGRVSALFDAPLPVLPHLEAKTLKVLAVTSAKRLTQLPDVPTMDEAGLTGYRSELWMGIFGPPGLSQAVVDALSSAIRSVIADPDLTRRMQQLGFEPVDGGPAELKKALADDLTRWGGLMRDAKLKAE